MCIQNTLQQHILDLTNDGKDVADFFYATMHGLNPNARFHHQMEAAKHLSKLGLDTALSLTTAEDPASANADVSQSPLSPRERVRVRAKDPSPLTGEGRACPEHSRRDGGEDHIDTPSPSTAEHYLPLPLGEGRGEGENPPHPVHPVKSAPVTNSDIINYKVARLIREETNDGYLIAEFLSRVMHGAAGQGRPISEADRIRAATELMNRGLGRFGDKPDRRISSTQDDRELIHSGLARYIREYTDGGLEPAYFLLEVASGRDEGFTMHQRVTAARELIRRGWDTNYDRITPDDIAAYYERQEAREPTSYDNRLQEWREKERAAQDAQDGSPEDQPQLEAGLFAHLSFDEIDRYEAMSAEEQADFVEQQRQYRANRQPAAAQHNTPSPSTGAQKPPLPQGEGWGEGIQKPPSPLTGEGRDGGEDSIAPEPRPEHSRSDESEDRIDTPSPSTGEGWDGGEDSIRPAPSPEHSRSDESEDRIDTPSPSTGEGWDGGEDSIRPAPRSEHSRRDESEDRIDTPSPSTGEGRDGGEDSIRPAPSPEHSRSDDGENPETTYWNNLPQDDTLSKSTPHPVRSATQTHIRSP